MQSTPRARRRTVATPSSGVASRAARWAPPLALALALATAAPVATAQPAGRSATPSPLRVATWNLGWHQDAALAARWIAACSQRFAPTGPDGRWAPSPAGDRTGWDLRWGRDARVVWDLRTLPPCDVYQARYRAVPVTAAAYATRQRQLRALLAERADADIVAFQEVSGVAAVREILPDGGAAHEVCGYDGFGVQQLAIAWKRAVGRAVACEVEMALSLPGRPPNERPRPGLALTLQLHDGRLVRVLTVHLKSSCVSPLEAGSRERPDRGRLDGDDDACRILQAQAAPLEAWVERQSQGVDALVLLGDFNRDLAHEQAEPAAAPARSDGGRVSDPHGPATRVRNLWRELADGHPPATALTLLAPACEGDAPVRRACEAARVRRLDRDEQSRLAAPSGLGCRHPVGLDHIAVSPGVQALDARIVPIGVYGRTLPASDRRADPLLAVSDHCPVIATLRIGP